MIFFESEEHEIAMSLRRVDLLITQVRQNELAYLDITPPQIGVLYFLQKIKTPCTVIQLRRIMVRSNSSLVNVINRMERKGLITRQADPQSKKYTIVSMTKKGKDIFDRALNLSSFATIISCLSKEDQQRLKSYLASLDKAVNKVLDEQHSANRKILNTQQINT